MNFDPCGLDRIDQAVGLYVHIPFCDVRCPYCHFYCFVNKDEDLPLRYVRALQRDFARMEAAGLIGGGLRSVYFGGGTPSALRGAAREELCRWLREELRPRCVTDAELTMEANPESAQREALAPWIEAGVDRLSLGLQSMDPATLQFLGRLNTPESNREVLRVATDFGVRISIDLIVGTPHSDEERLRRGLDEIFAWPVGHVSAYLLEIHDATRFGRDFAAGRLIPQPDERQCAIYLALADDLERRGLHAYELSNFAREGEEARHNRIYWRREPYLGLGASAHSFAQERRWWAPADAAAYCSLVEADQPAVDGFEQLDAGARRDEELLLGLRTAEGVPAEWLGAKAALVERFVAEGWMSERGDRLRMSASGWLLLDTIVTQLSQ